MKELLKEYFSSEEKNKSFSEYAIYLRKSRADMEAEKKGEGETLSRHEHILLDLADKNNYKIEYIHILGFNQKGKSYLNKIKKEVTLPLITNYNKLLDYQLLTDKIYALVSNDIKIDKPIFKNN